MLSKLLFPALLGLLPYAMQAQSSINAAGNDATGSGGTAAFSVGQVFYTSYSSSNHSTTQGVQQSYEITISTEDLLQTSADIVAFPNPSTDCLSLRIGMDDADLQLHYEVYDLQGKMLLAAPINSPQTFIYTAQMPAAAYIIRISDSTNKHIKTVQFVKQ